MRRLLGRLLVGLGLVREDELARALDAQKTRSAQLGEILVGMGCLDAAQLQAVLRIQDELSDPERALRLAAGLRLRLGEMLLASERVTPRQLAEALEEQGRSGLRLGEIAVRRGWLAPEQLERALRFQQAQAGAGVAGAAPLRLGELLLACGEISRAELEAALLRQRASGRPLGLELVDAGCLKPVRLAGMLQLQRRLVVAALAAALAVPMVPGLAQAEPVPQARTQVSIGAVVLRHVSVRVLAAPHSVEISEADIARGYVDLPLPALLELRSNSATPYLLSIETQAGYAHGTEVRGPDGVVSLGRFGGVLSLAAAGHGMQGSRLELAFRILLSAEARPGVHAWPVQLSVLPG